jgi:hypothetical protein
MKFWFTKKTPKEAYDGKAPYDATVEQVLRVAREVNSAPAETALDIFDFEKALRPNAEQDETPPPTSAQPTTAPPALTQPASAQTASILARPTVSRATREEMERRKASFRAFQIRLNDEREARIRRTMDDVRARLKQSDQDSTLS